ncbi:hypothetical protein D3C81_2050310 [compost metagenome]
MSDRRTSDYISAFANLHWCNQIDVAANEGIILNFCNGFIIPIIVNCYRTAANIYILAYLRIADIA